MYGIQFEIIPEGGIVREEKYHHREFMKEYGAGAIEGRVMTAETYVWGRVSISAYHTEDAFEISAHVQSDESLESELIRLKKLRDEIDEVMRHVNREWAENREQILANRKEFETPFLEAE